MHENKKNVSPILKRVDDIKPEQSALLYNKASENLIEITFVFAGLQAQGAHEKLCETDSITWKQMFVDWANEFETVHADDDWNQNDYLDEIKRYAQQKILEYAGLDG